LVLKSKWRNWFTKGSILATLALSSFSLLSYFSSPTYAAQHVWSAYPPIHVKKGGIQALTSGLSPDQMRKAYGLDRLSASGAGTTIAIVDAYGSPTIQNDLNTFNQQFGLPAADLTIVYPSGKPKRTDGGWALETALDVEWAHALAPQAKIMLVVAKSASTSDLLAAIDYATSNGAQVVSNSWGGSEFSSEASLDSHFQHSGVVYLASSGDSGAGASWPASSPYVVSVGGTTLNVDSNGNYLGESAWSGSGGATSAYEPRLSYQDNWTSLIGNYRGIPDVAFDADPNTGVAVYSSTSYQGSSGWFVVGGTSLSAPCWAALVALADQGRSTPFDSLSFLAAVYNLAGTTGSSGYTANFHDITLGDNGVYTAVDGYDMVTGIGSPKADQLIPDLNSSH
jgi:subtilase family serine protease